MRIVIILAFAVAFWPASAYPHPEAKVTVQVVEEDGTPIKGARAGIAFEIPGEGQSASIVSRGQTNEQGTYTGSERTTGYVACGARMDGYYPSQGVRYRFKTQSLNRWEPWNPTVTVVLRRIINPVPMYARKLETKIPVQGKPIGFDLVEADWVAPYGKGTSSDFVFTLTRKGGSWEDYEATLRITFRHDGDGIQSFLARPFEGSQLRLPHQAPEDGYQTELVLPTGYHRATGSIGLPSEDQNYIFRVRSEKRGDKIVRAHYGKIHGGIEYFAGNPDKKPGLYFWYYLNHDGTRNIEFDPKRNLFKNLKSLEEVNEP